MRRQNAAGWFLHDIKNRGVTAWLIFAALTIFYILVYGYRGGVMEPLANVFHSIMGTHSGSPDQWARTLIFFLPANLVDRWTLYGFIYSVAVSVGGGWVIWKYRHNRYQIIRTSVVIFTQVVFGFSIPHLLKFFQQPDYYFSYFWPLKFEYFQPTYIASHPGWLVFYTFAGSLVLVPVMTVLFGKRWYCSWICGCGGLANTFGEPWRHLSTKSGWSWKFEKVSIHTVLVLSFVTTAMWIVPSLPGVHLVEGTTAYSVLTWVRSAYALVVVTILCGMAGTALYPIGGTRVWCRFFCPMAAMIGLIQKFGRFRIRVKRDMCISCGMCSTYCEMGIDVRAYAQANFSFTRASCVGCGLCAEVCPRGVLRLENIWRKDPQELNMTALVDESWKGGTGAVQART